jgi:hypothetical protein
VTGDRTRRRKPDGSAHLGTLGRRTAAPRRGPRVRRVDRRAPDVAAQGGLPDRRRPYRKVDYYSDITQPTPSLIGFFAQVARKLGSDTEGYALFHLDQGMGGGKSHSLVGLFHMANNPEEFFATDLGHAVEKEASAYGRTVDITGTRPDRFGTSGAAH